MKILNTIRNHKKFIKNVATLFTGVAVARIIGFVSMPIVAWIFLPENYGVAAIFVAVVALATTAGTLSYDQSILLAKDDNEANQIMKVSMGILMLYTFIVLTICLIFFFNKKIILFNHISEWILLVPAGVFFLGLNNIAKNMAVRSNKYKRIAASEIGMSIVTPSSRITLGLLNGSSNGGLISGYLLGVVSQFLLLKKYLVWGGVFKELEFKKKIVKKYRDFAIYTTPLAFIKNILDYMPIFIFGIMFSPIVVGLFAFSNRVVRVSVSMVNQAVKQAYIQKSSEILGSNRSSRNALIKTTFSLVIIGVPLFIFIFMYSVDLFGFIFGDKWLDAGLYAKIMSPWLFTEFVITPSTATFVLLRKQSILLSIHLLSIILRSGAFMYSYLNNMSPIDTLLYLTIAGTIENIIIFLIALLFSGQQKTVAY